MIETRFKDTEVGIIPEDWEVLRIDEFCTRLKSNTLSRDLLDYRENGVFNVHYGDVLITYGEYVDASKDTLPTIKQSVKFNTCPSNLLQDGDIVMADTAEDEAVGKVSEIINIGNKQVVSGLHTIVLRPSTRTFAPKYLGYYFNSASYHNQLFPYMQGIKVISVSKAAVDSTFVFAPSNKLEQSRIASTLSNIDALISELDKLIEKKRAIKQGAMQELLTGKKRLKGFTEPWVERKLGDIATMNSGGTPSSKNPRYYDGPIRFLSISDMTSSGKYIRNTEKSITELGLNNSSARVFPAGTLMYAMYASLGKCSISLIDTAISQAILGFKLSDKVNRDFLYYHFNFIEDKVKTMGQTGTQSNLSKSIVEEFTISLPSMEEQQAIASIIANMDTELTQLESKRAKYQALKQGMMQQLLTGKIRLI